MTGDFISLLAQAEQEGVAVDLQAAAQQLDALNAAIAQAKETYAKWQIAIKSARSEARAAAGDALVLRREAHALATQLDTVRASLKTLV